MLGDAAPSTNSCLAAAAASMLAADGSRTDYSAARKSCGTDNDNELLWIRAKLALLYLLLVRSCGEATVQDIVERQVVPLSDF